MSRELARRLAEGAERVVTPFLPLYQKEEKTGKRRIQTNKKTQRKSALGIGFLLMAYEVSCRVWARRLTLHKTSVIHP
jgi:hypothetical protein